MKGSPVSPQRRLPRPREPPPCRRNLQPGPSFIGWTWPSGARSP
jgi:hypothetical protein